MVPQEPTVEEVWRGLLNGQIVEFARLRRLLKLLPADPRCKMCMAPFAGIGATITRRILRRRPWAKNPNYCDACGDFAAKHPGGAEVELSLLFADVRGSTGLAERMNPSEFTQLMNRFYAAATRVLVKSNAIIDKFLGDEVVSFYVPGFGGPDHARQAVLSAQELLRATGHHQASGPWIPVGVGVHTGRAFVGSVGSGSVVDVTALGDAVNITARLASQAGPGEILISDAAYAAAHLPLGELEHRRLELKGRTEPVSVHVLPVAPS